LTGLPGTPVIESSVTEFRRISMANSRPDATEREIVFPFQLCGDVEIDADDRENT